MSLEKIINLTKVIYILWYTFKDKMDKRVLHSPSTLRLVLFFLALHFSFASAHIQIKRKGIKKS